MFVSVIIKKLVHKHRNLSIIKVHLKHSKTLLAPEDTKNVLYTVPKALLAPGDTN